MKTFTMKLPVGLVWQYREFNRMVTPAPYIMFTPPSSLFELEKDILKNGIKDPIDLSFCNGKGTATEGVRSLSHSLVREKKGDVTAVQGVLPLSPALVREEQ